MDITIREMRQEDWQVVESIYMEGIQTKKATFQTQAPSYSEWDKGHLKVGRLVAINENEEILGWVALSSVSHRYVYRGVVEVSIYISEKSRGQHVGYKLMNEMIEVSEEEEIWTLQSVIFASNEASIILHRNCGFRMVGRREKIAKDCNGVWQDTVLMERRSKKIL